MKKNPRLLALVGLTAVTLVLTGCTGGTDPLAKNTLKGGSSASPMVSPTPTPTPTPSPSLSPVVEEESVTSPGVDNITRSETEADIYRDEKYILGYEIAKMTPSEQQLEAYPQEYTDTAIADTLHILEQGSSFSDYHTAKIPDNIRELLLTDYLDVTTPNGIRLIREGFDTSAFFIIPHFVPEVIDTNLNKLKWDNKRQLKISYTDFTFEYLKEKPGSDPLSVYSVVQKLQIPVEGNQILIIETRLYLHMEYGATSWLLDSWQYESLVNETVTQ